MNVLVNEEVADLNAPAMGWKLGRWPHLQSALQGREKKHGKVLDDSFLGFWVSPGHLGLNQYSCVEAWLCHEMLFFGC